MQVELSFEQKAVLRGLRSYDSALPQAWWDVAMKRTGVNPAGHVVWSYDEPHTIGGAPRAIDDTGDMILGILAGSVS